MSITITTRLPERLVRDLGAISEREHLDKSTVIRRLLADATQQWKIDYAVQKYKDGTFSFGQATDFSGLDVWTFTDILRERRVILNYDINDLEMDLRTIKWKQ